jgi:NADPH:quinone reductase-like Zn-dependent oxidoreductase
MLKNRGVFGFNLGRLWHRGPESAAMLAEILDLMRANAFAPCVDRSFPLDRAGDAHRYIQDRRNFGKVVLVPSSRQ